MDEVRDIVPMSVYATDGPVGEMGSSPGPRFRNRSIVTLVAVLVFLPGLLFALSLRPLPALLILIGTVGALILVRRNAGRDCDLLDRPVAIKPFCACILAALVIFLLGGETHLFHATSDWLIRDAVLADLARTGSPPVYMFEGADYVLRAPLGMYMVPAFVGRLLGLSAAHLALLVQNALFLGCIFYLLATMGRGWRHIAIIVAFSGASVIGALIQAASKHETAWSFWIGRGLDSWLGMIQYSASLTQFFWVPNHALPGWWLATLLLLQTRTKVDVATIGVFVAALSFWSPLAVLPAVLCLVVIAAMAWRSVLLAGRTWLGLAASLCLLPLAIYQVLATASLAHETFLNRPGFLFLYGLFVVLHLPALVFVAICWRRIPKALRTLVAVNGLILLILPFFNFGVNNDLVMRGSIASLTIVAFVFGLILIDLYDRRAVMAWIGGLIVVAGLPTVAVELARAVVKPRYPISACSLLEASRAIGDMALPTNYLARADQVPAWLMDLRGKTAIPTDRDICWPGVPVKELIFPKPGGQDR